MVTKALRNPKQGSSVKVELEICLGKSDIHTGVLHYSKDGSREFTQFAYKDTWLSDAQFFDISPDLQRTPGYQLRKAPTKEDTLFFLALGDTEPDTWGRRVIARAHAKARKKDKNLPALTELDYLCAVDDFSRVGALRLRDPENGYLRTTEEGERTAPVLVDLEKLMAASRAVEEGKESETDLEYLLGNGTSLGGMRPKCTVLDHDKSLALGKFPSIKDERSVTRGEVLALLLASKAGINAAAARIELVQGTPVAIVKRFDRTDSGARIPYMSGATLLQVSRGDEHAYTEVVDVMRQKCANFAKDAQQLWRRLVFSHLITNVDDHLQNIGFLYVGDGLWELSPAFDINPFPDKDRESKTWLNEGGPITSIDQLLEAAPEFSVSSQDAREILAEVVAAVSQWRALALSAEVGLTADEIDEFAPAFEHSELEAAQAILAQ